MNNHNDQTNNLLRQMVKNQERMIALLEMIVPKEVLESQKIQAAALKWQKDIGRIGLVPSDYGRDL